MGGMDMLDTLTQIQERDRSNALGLAAGEPEQLTSELSLIQTAGALPTIKNIVVAGMGGSALAADMMRDWLDLSLPLQVVKDYALPNYVSSDTLVIVCSFSGNTEETLAAYEDAHRKNSHIVIAAGRGRLLEIAREQAVPYIVMPYDNVTPRLFVLENLKAFLVVLVTYGIVDATPLDELVALRPKLEAAIKNWQAETPSKDNLAKQLAWHCAGKTPVVYAWSRMRSIAYKWKISFNETAKNTAFCNEYSEFNHNEFLGWSSHPVEKPFAVIDLRSSFEPQQITKRFTLSDRLLSGKRPKSITVQLEGDSMIEQMAWGVILADYVSIYLGILNGVDPAPVELIERFKKELANS